MSQNAKVAIVTGASQGIGARLVEAYLGRGYRVVANSRSIQPGNAHSPDVFGVPGDISEPETAKRVVQAAVERFGGVDTLVNNAGIFVAKPFADYTAEDYNKVLTVNLQGFFYVTQQAVREMLKRGGGHIVQITTTLADQPIKGVAAALAALTKGGLNAVTRSLAIEYAEQGIRVNAVAPGIIKTPMHAPETHEFLAGLHPLKRMGEVQEIVDAVLYLESAGFVTGEVLHVDGGQHAGKWWFIAAAKAAGEFGYGAQWAGQGAPLARKLSAAELVQTLWREVGDALAMAKTTASISGIHG